MRYARKLALQRATERQLDRYERRMVAKVENLLAELSRISALAYVFTDYFGGVGEQSALAFVGGRLATAHGGVGRVLPWSSSIGPINNALAAIGVVRGRGQDEGVPDEGIP